MGTDGTTPSASLPAVRQENAVGTVQTVLGPVTPDSLGVVLPREHLLWLRDGV